MALKLLALGRQVQKGSRLGNLGHEVVFSQLGEMPIVEGSGLIGFARGYAQAKTRALDLKTGYAVVGVQCPCVPLLIRDFFLVNY